jgi:phospholipid/cholesterol/gamma-HCH transport system ATP-binding protein
VVFLHESGVRFFGTVAEMDASEDDIVREFLLLDRLEIPA